MDGSSEVEPDASAARARRRRRRLCSALLGCSDSLIVTLSIPKAHLPWNRQHISLVRVGRGIALPRLVPLRARPSIPKEPKLAFCG